MSPERSPRWDCDRLNPVASPSSLPGELVQQVVRSRRDAFFSQPRFGQLPDLARGLAELATKRPHEGGVAAELKIEAKSIKSLSRQAGENSKNRARMSLWSCNERRSPPTPSNRRVQTAAGK